MFHLVALVAEVEHCQSSAMVEEAAAEQGHQQMGQMVVGFELDGVLLEVLSRRDYSM